jgi:hypothetical protein
VARAWSGETISPDPGDQLIDRHRTVDIHEQNRQHASLPGVAQGHRPSVDAGLDGAEHPELHRHFDRTLLAR